MLIEEIKRPVIVREDEWLTGMKFSEVAKTKIRYEKERLTKEDYESKEKAERDGNIVPKKGLKHLVRQS